MTKPNGSSQPSRSTGAAEVFLLIAGSWALIGGLLSGVSFPMRAGPQTDRAMSLFSAGLADALQGATVGLGFGLLLAIPAALIVWLAGGRYRPVRSVSSDDDGSVESPRSIQLQHISIADDADDTR